MEDYVNKANDETLVTVLFEDIVAINSLEEIVTVDHIEVFYVAPGDLAQSMILTGQTPTPTLRRRLIGASRQSSMLARSQVCLSTIRRWMTTRARAFGKSEFRGARGWPPAPRIF